MDQMKIAVEGRKSIYRLMFLIVVLAGCSSVKGTYTCDGSLMDALKLDGSDKAIVAMTYLGQKSETTGSYKVDGDKVTITLASGQAAVFTRSGKILDGGEIGGKCTMQ